MKQASRQQNSPAIGFLRPATGEGGTEAPFTTLSDQNSPGRGGALVNGGGASWAAPTTLMPPDLPEFLRSRCCLTPPKGIEPMTEPSVSLEDIIRSAAADLPPRKRALILTELLVELNSARGLELLSQARAAISLRMQEIIHDHGFGLTADDDRAVIPVDMEITIVDRFDGAPDV